MSAARPGHARARRRRRETDAGLTLVEVLLAVSIMGVGMVVVIGGMMTSIQVSDAGRRSADGQGVLRAYAEAVGASTYTACATAYAAPGFSAAGWSATQVVSYWNGSAFAATCGTDPGLQRVAISLTSGEGTVETLAITKRAP